jgi:hypothetical protein
MGVSGYGSFFCLWAVRARSAQGRVFTEPWATPPTAGAMKIEKKIVILGTASRQPWPLPPPIGPPRPFCSRARVDRAMGDTPYRRHHENLAGVDLLPTIHHGIFLHNNSSSWAPPAMVSTAAYGLSAAIPLKDARLQGHG